MKQKQTIKPRLLAWLLTICMVVGMLPTMGITANAGAGDAISLGDPMGTGTLNEYTFPNVTVTGDMNVFSICVDSGSFKLTDATGFAYGVKNATASDDTVQTDTAYTSVQYSGSSAADAIKSIKFTKADGTTQNVTVSGINATLNSGDIYFGGHIYEVSDTAMTWEAAMEWSLGKDNSSYTADGFIPNPIIVETLVENQVLVNFYYNGGGAVRKIWLSAVPKECSAGTSITYEGTEVTVTGTPAAVNQGSSLDGSDYRWMTVSGSTLPNVAGDAMSSVYNNIVPNNHGPMYLGYNGAYWDDYHSDYPQNMWTSYSAGHYGLTEWTTNAEVKDTAAVSSFAVLVTTETQLNDAITNGYTKIILGADITANISDFAGDSLILDLNGHTLTGSGNAVVTVNTGKTLTVIDSSEPDTGLITGAKMGIVNNGTLTFEAGKIEVSDCGILTSGTLTINGGDIRATSVDAVKIPASATSPVVTVNGGMLIGGNYGIYDEAGMATGIINGGTLGCTNPISTWKGALGMDSSKTATGNWTVKMDGSVKVSVPTGTDSDKSFIWGGSEANVLNVTNYNKLGYAFIETSGNSDIYSVVDKTTEFIIFENGVLTFNNITTAGWRYDVFFLSSDQKAAEVGTAITSGVSYPGAETDNAYNSAYYDKVISAKVNWQKDDQDAIDASLTSIGVSNMTATISGSEKTYSASISLKDLVGNSSLGGSLTNLNSTNKHLYVMLSVCAVGSTSDNTLYYLGEFESFAAASDSYSSLVSDFDELEQALAAGYTDITLTDDIDDANATLEISNKVTINGNGYTLKRAQDFDGTLIKVPTGGDLTLNDVIVDGGAVWTATEGAAAPHVDTGVTPALINNIQAGGVVASATAGGGGQLIFVNGGTLNLGAGTILQNNDRRPAGAGTSYASISDEGSAVYVYGGILNMDDDVTIRNNRVADPNKSVYNGDGAAISIENCTSAVISGTITGNYSGRMGGAIRVFQGNTGSVTIQDATITKNYVSNSAQGAVAIGMAVTVSGEVVIEDNHYAAAGSDTTDHEANVVFNATGKLNEGSTELTSGSNIGITGIDGTVIGNGFESADAALFFADDATLDVIFKGTDSLILTNKFVEDYLTAADDSIITEATADNYAQIIGGETDWNALSDDEKAAVNAKLTVAGSTKTYPELLAAAKALDAAADTFIKENLTGSNGKIFTDATQSNYKEILAAVSEWDKLSQTEKDVVNAKLTAAGGKTFEKLVEGASAFNKADVPQTGDSADLLLWMTLMVLSSLALLVIAFNKKVFARK